MKRSWAEKCIYPSGWSISSNKLVVIRPKRYPGDRLIMTWDVITLRYHKTSIFLNLAKCIFCDEWVQNFVQNFKGHLWNFAQNFEPIYRKLCILLYCVFPCELRYLWIVTSYALVRYAPEKQTGKHWHIMHGSSDCIYMGCWYWFQVWKYLFYSPHIISNRVYMLIFKLLLFFHLSFIWTREECWYHNGTTANTMTF